ncbi:penicillin acylase family protein [Pseudoduganella sp. GCM10020061]|uniref:penicillin acylase family protein n=1 Tax=Pseudoduganella sp. GCM10020061 TaxID=3317345 RepID=UPI00363B1FFC
MRLARWNKWALWTGVALLSLLVVAVAGAWMFLRASLPQLDGTVRSLNMTGTVTVARDAHGAPVIRGANRHDIAYVTGYIHAQERFFQMDLLRRSAAGELAELFGEKALPLDRVHRLHRFRARAERTIAAMPPEDRQLLDRYVSGVNDGINALGARPFEYALTGTRPRAWMAADSLLVAWAMFFDLQDNLERRELARGWLREHSTAEQLDFLLPQATQWDSPLDGEAPGDAAPIPAAAPGWWGKRPPPDHKGVFALAASEYADSVGSNNFAIAGGRSKTGGAIVSNDMHLGINLPNTWYRVALQYPDADGNARRVVGLTLPGTPLVLVGSNGHIAWGFTNSYGDYLDLIAVETSPEQPGRVRARAEWEEVTATEELIMVKGAAPHRMVVRETPVGPLRVIGNKTYALHWTAHAPNALNFNAQWLEAIETVEGALAVANTMGVPAQNFVVGDRNGSIGWTIAGALPRRPQYGIGSTFPLAAGDPHIWDGTLDPAEYPRVVDPLAGQVSTANSRQLAGAGAELIGDGGFDLGARQSQLRNSLLALGAQVDTGKAYGVMLDDRALYLAPWRERALRALDSDARRLHPHRDLLHTLLKKGWTGRASTDSVAYRLTREYMWAVHALLFDGVNAELGKLDEKANINVANPRWSVVVARLLDEQPPGWLPPGYPSWKEFSLAALDKVIRDRLTTGKTLDSATWGERNTLSIAHPISGALPQLRPWLAAPADQLPGDGHMPRVAGPKFGQSERFTVTPGKEEQGVFSMPGGQSGHPLSPYFLSGHRDWAQGRSVPLLPGPAVHTLTFTR